MGVFVPNHKDIGRLSQSGSKSSSFSRSGGASGPELVVPTSGEHWDFSMPSGNLVSTVGEDTYAVSGSPTYGVESTEGLTGVYCANNTQYFSITALPAAFDPLNQDFVFALKYRHVVNPGAGVSYLVDFGNSGQSSSREGFTIILLSSSIIINANGATNWISNTFSHGGEYWEDGTDRLMLVIFDRSEDDIRLIIDGVELTPGASSRVLSGIGSMQLNASGNDCGFGRQLAVGSNGAGARYYQAALALGTKTYDGTNQ